MDIDKLEAGRKLDALVAERVMGWKRSKNRDGALYRITYFDATNDVHYVLEANYDCYMWALPPFSTDIVAAWKVVEYFNHGCDGHVMSSVEIHVTDLIDPYEHVCKIYGPDRAKVVGVADTTPLAICRAALKAVAG